MMKVLPMGDIEAEILECLEVVLEATVEVLVPVKVTEEMEICSTVEVLEDTLVEMEASQDKETLVDMAVEMI